MSQDQIAAKATEGFEAEVKQGERFQFGANWARFLTTLNEDKIKQAEQTLREMLEVTDLQGKSFLDIGSGSGLFSLAARRLGARVHSLDYDPNSVGCTHELRKRYFPEDPEWVVERASALDPVHMGSLGKFDVVYSWGVLHHTGSMWLGLENAVLPTAPGSKLFIAIYNQQGLKSRVWKIVKRTYCKSPQPIPFLIAILVLINTWWKQWVKDTLKGNPFRSWREYGKMRGMTPWYDILDWAGGYPFEVASSDELFNFYKKRGFTLTQLITNRGSGCNELVFVRGSEPKE